MQTLSQTIHALRMTIPWLDSMRRELGIDRESPTPLASVLRNAQQVVAEATHPLWTTRTVADTMTTYQSMRFEAGEITLEARPHYCNRGRFIAKVHIKFGALKISSSDLWPRYYFDEDVAKTECEAWLKAHHQAFEQA